MIKIALKFKLDSYFFSLKFNKLLNYLIDYLFLMFS